MSSEIMSMDGYCLLKSLFWLSMHHGLKPRALFIAASQRPDGSWRKPRRVKDGYVPQDEVPLYESKGKQWAKSKPDYPIGLAPEDVEKHRAAKSTFSADDLKIEYFQLPTTTPPIPGLPITEAPSQPGQISKSAKKNAKRKEKKKVAAATSAAAVTAAAIGDSPASSKSSVSDFAIMGLDAELDKLELGSDDASPESYTKRLRNLRKKLRDIEALERRLTSGELPSADKDQLEKVKRKEQVVKEIAMTRSHSGLRDMFRAAARHIQRLMFIGIDPSLSRTTIPPTFGARRDLISSLYDCAYQASPHLDARVLLGPLKHPGQALNLRCPVEVVLFDTGYSEDFMKKYIEAQIPNRDPGCRILSLDVLSHDSSAPGTLKDSPSVKPKEKFTSFDHVVVGGTFDRLHHGHKIFLSEALLLTRKILTVGVADGPLIQNKKLMELIEPCNTRIEKCLVVSEETLRGGEKLNVMRREAGLPEMALHVVTLVPETQQQSAEEEEKISSSSIRMRLLGTPLRPSKCLVVSEETLRGGEKLNVMRREAGLSEMALHVVTLVPETQQQSAEEEEKISSSSIRMRLLGTPLRPSKPKPNLPKRPLVIGLTGGICSGKTNICRKLEDLGAGIVDCDALGHRAYAKQTSAYHKVLDAFGRDILDGDGNIDRKKLGAKVFGNKPKPNLPKRPLVIGLTGGICSGKTNICRKLEDLGAGIVDCDALGHRAYAKQTSAYHKVLDVFGRDILDGDGNIDRKKLGAKVFGNKEEMARLTGIVWPEIQKKAMERIREFGEEGKEVVVLDAAVLLEAGWDAVCHVVWVSFVPEQEAVKRLEARDGVDAEAARRRLASQWSNRDRIARADVVFSSLWSYDFTRGQTSAYHKVLDAFGRDILDGDGNIDRKKLGAKVFGNKEEMARLTGIVWPEIQKKAMERIREFGEEGKEVVVLDAAVLLEAGWDAVCHVVWVSFVPEQEAVKRLEARDGVDAEAARRRLASQWSNRDRIARADVVFSSLWSYDFTRGQVERAFKDLVASINLSQL
ncbi:unnamed protein product [Darwinula stevensoni]|uniref:Partner of Y14 and mago n=1 Tax=Darwinula stevensoni TaxID=69355 RepID=A0A7R8XCW8_9CRUS|nr:unnamed protein product [Darwinula stevensoni]CAG0886200.1 unnamed protein product [Darwinula stevensoni]